MGDVVDLRTTLGAAPIQRDVVRVEGPEAVDFLQGQLSQDVAALATPRPPSFSSQPARSTPGCG
jgi:folate-binding Fe-S cluster repair protein YgfZ